MATIKDSRNRSITEYAGGGKVGYDSIGRYKEGGMVVGQGGEKSEKEATKRHKKKGSKIVKKGIKIATKERKKEEGKFLETYPKIGGRWPVTDYFVEGLNKAAVKGAQKGLDYVQKKEKKLNKKRKIERKIRQFNVAPKKGRNKGVRKFKGGQDIDELYKDF